MRTYFYISANKPCSQTERQTYDLLYVCYGIVRFKSLVRILNDISMLNISKDLSIIVPFTLMPSIPTSVNEVMFGSTLKLRNFSSFNVFLRSSDNF